MMMMSLLPRHRESMQGGTSLIAYLDPPASLRSEQTLFVRTVILFGQNSGSFPLEY